MKATLKINQKQTKFAGAAPTISLLSQSPSGSYIHVLVYVLPVHRAVPAWLFMCCSQLFFIQSMDSSAISLLPIPSPPHRGAELQPRAEEDFTALPRLTWL